MGPLRPSISTGLDNNNGGEMSQTYGVPVEEIERGIKSGVEEINMTPIVEWQ